MAENQIPLPGNQVAQAACRGAGICQARRLEGYLQRRERLILDGAAPPEEDQETE